jgi:predicted TIM-barrel fold metal-dependent hydrolase
MRIIDADSHFMEPLGWFHESFPELAARCPTVPLIDMVCEALMGDLVSSLPADLGLSSRDLLPDRLLRMLDRWDDMETKNASGSDAREHVAAMQEAGGWSPAQYEGKARLAWADEHGIDVQIMLPTLGYMPYRTAMRAGLRQEAFEALGAYNTWAAAQLAGYTDRLIPVTLVDLGDLEWSLAEIVRTRALGSRVVQIRAEPAAGQSLAHPAFERFWSTVEDLDMTIMLHVGGGRAPLDPGWIDNGGHPLDYSLMYNAFVRRLVPELTLSALILRGVLERHPGLRFIVAELGVHWLPGLSGRLDGAVARAGEAGMGMAGDFGHLKLRPSEYLQRQVRVSMLASEPGLDDVRRRSPEGVLVFSSDFPHPEGTKDPMAVFETLLADASEPDREQFYGGSLAELTGF